MKRFAIVLTCALSLGEAWAACEPRVEPVEVAEIPRSELSSIVVDPPAGTAVGKDTILAIDLEYRIGGFAGHEFQLSPQFRTDGIGGSRSFDIDGKEPEVPLKFAAGRVRLCLPLAHFYAEDTDRVLWPLELLLSILQSKDAFGWQAVARSDSIAVNAEIPAGVLERQAQAPPKEYAKALEGAFYYFAGRAAFYKACVQRFPDMQTQLIPTYRSWESRHRADIDYVSKLQFETIKKEIDGRVEVAAMILDKMNEAHFEAYSRWKSDDLKRACEDLLDNVSAKNDDAKRMVADHLDVLRNWQEKKKQ